MVSDQECSLDTQAFRHIREQFLSEADIFATKTSAYLDHDEHEGQEDGEERGDDGEEDGGGDIRMVAVRAPRVSATADPPTTLLAQSRLSVQGGNQLPTNRLPQRATAGGEGRNIIQNLCVSNNLLDKTRRGIVGAKTRDPKSEDVLKTHATATQEQRLRSPNRSRSVPKNSSVALKRRGRQMADVASSIEPNDTQYLPSQAIIDHLKAQYSLANASRSFADFDGVDEASDSEPRTYRTGDTGHIDLALGLASLDGQQHEDYSKSGEDGESEDELGRSQSEAEDDAVTSPAPTSPTTPAVTGQKRDREGNAALSQSTPLSAENLAAMFKAPAMKSAIGLSQVFKQTQAATSPLPDGPKSDAIFERPSPEFRMLYNQTSPSSSSPVRIRNRRIQGAGMDPKAMYVSMKDSQDERNRQIKQGLLEKQGSLSDVSGDEDELGQDSEERRAERRQRKAEIDAAARREFAALSAPNGFDRKAKTAVELPTVETPANRIQPETIIISDDTPQIPAINEDEYDVSEDESRDEYDELGQGVIGSDLQRSNHLEEDGLHLDFIARPTSSPLPNNNERSVTDTRLTQTFHGGLRDEWNQERSSIINTSPSSLRHLPSQSVKVADSQADRTDFRGNSKTAYSTRRVFASSVHSKNFVSQSQDLPNSTSLPDDLSPQSDVPKSSSIPHAPLMSSNPNADQRSSLLSDFPLSRLQPLDQSAFDMMTTTNEQLNNSSTGSGGMLENGQSLRLGLRKSRDYSSHIHEPHGNFTLKERAHKPEVPSKRKPIRTITDTSPISTANFPRSPQNTESHATKVTAPISSETREHNLKEANEENYPPAISRSINLYDTARTHQSPSPELEILPPNPNLASPKAARLKKFGSMGLSPARLDQPSSAEAIFDVLNEHDTDYETAMLPASQDIHLSEPREIKSRGKRKALQEPVPEANAMPLHGTPWQAPSPQGRSQRSLPNLVKEVTTRTSERHVKGKLRKPTKNVKRNSRAPANSFQVPDNLTQVTADPESQKDDHDANGNRAGLPSEHEEAQIDPLARRSQTPLGEQGLDEQGLDEQGLDEQGLDERGLGEQGDDAGTMPPPNAPAEATRGSTNKRLFSNQILARFKDTKNNYYPATCIGRHGSNGSFVVRYDDGNVDDDVSPNLVRSLELRPGDVVKVDRQSLRTKDFIIRELGNITSTHIAGTDVIPVTDIFGHQSALVGRKQRDSLPNDGQTSDAESLEVQICEIYLTSKLWVHFANRIYEHDQAPDPNSRIHTPIDLLSRQSTPSSRSRRQTLVASKKHGPQGYLHTVESNSGLFSNMVFAISYHEKRNEEKNAVSKLITENGGRLLSDSFVELFDKSSWLPNSGHEVDLTLTLACTNLGFSALVTDNCSRRPKFVQALALNIPCLSGRWIVDSVAKRTILPWMHYLLPAGESALLGGSLRSRTFSEDGKPVADASIANLNTMISHRPNPFQGQSIVMVMGRRAKGQTGTKERRELHVFLSCALGAKRVARVKDIAAAGKLLEQHDLMWDWMNVDDRDVEDAKAAVLRDNSAVTPETRKRRKTADDTVLAIPHVDSYPIKVVGEEFVVQSLIVGALMDSSG